MIRSSLFAPLLVLAACQTTHSSMSDNAASRTQFDTLRTLEGEWTGTADHGGGQTSPVDTTFHVTGNGSTVQETMFRGSPHEMVSMYHLDGDQLVQTHYCAAGNQPRMVAKPASEQGVIAFDFKDATNMKSMDDVHMHSMRILVKDKDHVEEWWQGWENGKPSHESHFMLTRKGAKTAMAMPEDFPNAILCYQ
jgi:hypothetical protein